LQSPLPIHLTNDVRVMQAIACSEWLVAEQGCEDGIATVMGGNRQKYDLDISLVSAYSSHPSRPNQAPQSSSHQQQSAPAGLHVFMTSKVGGHYLLSQWNTTMPRPQNDRELFRELRKRYISARSHWRYYLGFRVLSHCEFYRVSHLDLQTYALSDLNVAQEIWTVNF
jgi:hypothetical protein